MLTNICSYVNITSQQAKRKELNKVKSAVQIRNLIELINKANRAYYYCNSEIMSNKEYDDLYDELVKLEKDTGIIYPDSPTQNLGEHIYSELPKVKHKSPMLSLDKTKDRQVLVGWLKQQEGVLSWKLDGLTIVLTYDGGKLISAVTRGNGEIGEDVTENAKYFRNVPLQIPFKGRLVLRGEAVISYEDFNRIKESENNDYKNARNLASASVRLLDSSKVKKRSVQVIIFQVITGTELDLVTERFNWISNLGFIPVQHVKVNSGNILEEISNYENRIAENPIPTDGLVLTYNNASYGLALGSTGKFPRHSIAFKWKDETAETTLRGVRWQTSRTGVINPVAEFDTVELEGTDVSKATLNNVGFIRQLKLGIGDKIEVYKANMIIPQILRNLTQSNSLEIPKICPECGGLTAINESEILYCTNPECPAKLINHLVHFCSRDGMNISGLSKKTLEFLVDKGWVYSIIDIYNLEKYKGLWVASSGFSSISVNKLLNAIEESRNTEPERFLYALGIPLIGKSQSKELIKKCKTWDGFVRMLEANYYFGSIQGFGDMRNQSIYHWYKNVYHKERIDKLASMMNFTSAQTSSGDKFKGKSFVITGKLSKFKNRTELVDYIEENGGKVIGSVSAKTDYLINNDTTSASSKNKKAKELNIPIINEETLLSL